MAGPATLNNETMVRVQIGQLLGCDYAIVKLTGMPDNLRGRAMWTFKLKGCRAKGTLTYYRGQCQVVLAVLDKKGELMAHVETEWVNW